MTKTPTKHTAPKYGLKGINKKILVIQKELSILAVKVDPYSTNESERIQHSIRNLFDSILKQLVRKKIQHSQLTLPSQRTLRWLEFINHPDHFQAHIKSLSLAYRLATVLTRQPEKTIVIRSLPVEISFFNTSSLFRGITSGKKVIITIHEGYTGAPENIIRSLVFLALGEKDRRQLVEVRSYSHQPTFNRIIEQLRTNQYRSLVTSGTHIDLNEVFTRINQHYFEGKLPLPRMGWSRTKTRRKLGHFQIETDTLIISRTLDDPTVPEYVVDYVMYHELLHKYLGVKKTEKTRRAHTADFRAAESSFEQYGAAQAFLGAFLPATDQGKANGQMFDKMRKNKQRDKTSSRRRS